MSDNLDFYRKVAVRPPGVRTLQVGVLLVSVVFGSISAFVLFRSAGLSANLVGAAIATLFFYLLPSILSAEIVARATGVTRQWTYGMSLIDQGAVFLFSVIIPFSRSTAEGWQIMWLGLATVYLINLGLVVMAKGGKRFYMNLVYPLLYPGWLIIVFHLFIGRLIGIQKIVYLRSSVFFVISAFLLILTLLFFEFVMRANLRGLSATDFFSTMILGEEQELAGGIMADIPHQALHIENGRRLTFNIPWVHPGPVAGFGGGRLTSELIGEDTFMLHIPSYHTLDLASPQDIGRFRDVPDAERSDRASELVRIDHEGFTFYGRRYGDRTIVFIENRGIDDYAPSIIYDLKEKYPDLCLIDLHNQAIGPGLSSLQYFEAEVAHLREGIDLMVAELADSELQEYRAGHAGNQDYCCLVEEVNGQRTCLLGVDSNGAPDVLHRVEDRLLEEFDQVLVFTTDSHQNLLEMARPWNYSEDQLLEAVQAAEQDLSDARAGIGERVVSDVRVLGKSYEGLITTMNVMGRLVPIALILYYIAIIFLLM